MKATLAFLALTFITHFAHAAPFGFQAESMTQIEKSAWLISKPYYFNATTKFWLAIDARPESDEDPDHADREICKKLGFQNARAETRIAAYPWLEANTYNIATINQSAEILGLDTDVTGLTPTFIYLRLICLK